MEENYLSEEMVERTAAFHGHMCPGLAIGIRAAEVALREIGPHAHDEEIVAVVETDMCGVDAIQFLTGCTFGKGNLIHLDYGKNAFTFYRRSDDKGIRIVTRPDAFGEPDPEWETLRNRLGDANLTQEERDRFRQLHAARSRQILDIPLEKLFEVKEPQGKIPSLARIMESVTCESCGEVVMETRTRRFSGKTVCIPCFNEMEQR
ncbi:MAG: TraR/DksA C4-type zinc finger protein [Deltaproteobacteria bacterium]|nr:MAG: TraR/DksA C4-type zinc finger protein [Deltaproteobacteria bacterium]